MSQASESPQKPVGAVDAFASDIAALRKISTDELEETLKLIRLTPAERDALVNVGAILYNKGRTDGAKDFYERMRQAL